MWERLILVPGRREGASSWGPALGTLKDDTVREDRTKLEGKHKRKLQEGWLRDGPGMTACGGFSFMSSGLAVLAGGWLR